MPLEYVVSACLAGCKCRYNAESTPHPKVLELVAQGKALPICPEQLGGLPTPRPPFELQKEKAITYDGEDVTEKLHSGALQALELVTLAGCSKAIMKNRSPSCGAGTIYDGTFSGKCISGEGVFTQMLRQKGLHITPDTDL